MFPPVSGVSRGSPAFEPRAKLRTYADRKALREPGGVLLRPWMLNFDSHLGMKGVLEPVPASAGFATLPNTKDVLQMVCQLILSSTLLAPVCLVLPDCLRFSTDPNNPGTEKLAVAAIEPSFLVSAPARPTLQATDIVADEGVGKDLLNPMSVFHVKGWTRSVCAITVLLHAFKDQDALKAGHSLSTRFFRLLFAFCFW